MCSKLNLKFSSYSLLVGVEIEQQIKERYYLFSTFSRAILSFQADTISAGTKCILRSKHENTNTLMERDSPYLLLRVRLTRRLHHLLFPTLEVFPFKKLLMFQEWNELYIEVLFCSNNRSEEKSFPTYLSHFVYFPTETF